MNRYVVFMAFGAGNRHCYTKLKFCPCIHNFLFGEGAACVRVIGGTQAFHGEFVNCCVPLLNLRWAEVKRADGSA